MSAEIWKSVPTAPLYDVSNFGRVRRGGFVLTPTIRNGYPKVGLSVNGVKHQCSVHRLVAELFIPNTEMKRQVNHKDGCKTNNCADNLEWVEPKQNIRHAIDNGLRKTKINAEQAAAIRCERRDGKDPKEIAEKYGISRSAVHNIAAGRKWPQLELPL